jgi:patatin-related protein
VPEQGPPFELEQEVRFAVVMYGGVSLAIYINGVAQELFRLVRATAPARQYPRTERKEVDNRTYFSDDELDASERVYRDIGRMLNLSGEAESDAVRTRFVVDIISGTSAGGIKGVLLGLALAEQKDFRESATLWRKVADINTLLRDKEESYEGLPAATPRDSQSLLNGYRLYFKAREAMADMPAEIPRDPFRPAYAEQIDLAVTTTDLAGLPEPIRLTETRSIEELSHRKVFRFSYGTDETTGEDHTDFEDLDHLMLGFAARATSSFPFAFEPVRLDDVAALPPKGKPPEPPVRLERFFREEQQVHRDPAALAYADGGYLDNKPFSYATEALRRRRADVPVARKLVYIEPHPVEAEPEKAAAGARPDVIENVMASLILPRHETIREDVAAVAQRNVAIGRLRELGLFAEQALDAVDPLAPLHGIANLDEAAVHARLGPGAPAYLAYRTLRVRTVLDALAELGAGLRTPPEGEDPARDVTREIRLKLREWIEGEGEGAHDGFLRSHDAAFVQRRLSFLHDRVNDLLRRGARATCMLEVAGRPGAGESLAPNAPMLRKLKLALNDAVAELRRVERAPHAKDLAKTLNGEPLARFEAVRAAAQGLPDGTGEFVDAVGTLLSPTLERSEQEIENAIGQAEHLEPWLIELLAAYNKRFEAYDMVVLPLAYPDLGETNPVEIVRISPFDARNIAPEDPEIADDPALKLAGIKFGHFGGFLDESWRNNDIMWGRLDAAEVIIDTLLGAEHPRAKELRERTQAAIVCDSVEGALRQQLEAALGAPLEAGKDDARLIAEFREAFQRPPDPPPGSMDDLVSDGLKTGSDVLADAAKKRKWPAGLLRVIALAGRGVVETLQGWGKLKRRLGGLFGRG